MGIVETTLEATSEELGTFLYALKLVALPPVPETAVHFTASLGEIMSQNLVLKNEANERVEFFTQVTSNVEWSFIYHLFFPV